MPETDTNSARRSRALRLLEDVLITFGASESTQHFSDNPIRMSVWLAFAAAPDTRHSLLIDLNYLVRAQQAMRVLRLACRSFRPEDPPPLHSFGSIVIASTDMDDMIWAILPQTYWFQRLDPAAVAEWRASVARAARTRSLATLRAEIAESPMAPLWRFLVAWMVIRKAQAAQAAAKTEATGDDPPPPGRWELIRRACLHLLNVTDNELDAEEAEATHAFVTAFLSDILEHYGARLDRLIALQAGQAQAAADAPIWSIDLNRPAELASCKSRQTLKVDAAENVFRISTGEIRWAIIDSGIDARHPAFDKEGKPRNAAIDTRSRVVATYDFTRLTRLFDGDYESLLPPDQTESARALIDPGKPDSPQSLQEAVLVMLHVLNGNANDHVTTADLAERIADPQIAARAVAYLRDVQDRLDAGEILDWPLLEPVLQVPHVTALYQAPENGHGTHVAGILGARIAKGALGKEEGPASDHLGMCPDIRLYDLRVCDAMGRSDEFRVMAALQFIAYLNRTREMPVIHGANVSLQIKHDVRNYGCGQTPVCKEANRLVDSGVCVVAAAGNRGFHTVVTDKALVDDYAWCSVMDPGNAEKVITVGSTHRVSPHTFGVSYFSSRGPTADGRPKPDLVAPGEKILAPAPARKMAEDTGTSMSAPHVSGAAAMLMARYPEMKGQPGWVKRVLCDTASDLGRRAEFQGAGLVDVLRALESI
ncbi:MAG: hypothetical protein EP318_04380 [Rhodobacteraceae bacterium]|nr:MAG: hypothetical protein EP318_04380 [Paracoccaceae bacterium]